MEFLLITLKIELDTKRWFQTAAGKLHILVGFVHKGKFTDTNVNDN